MNANAAPPVVLVADDEPTMLELVARHLRSIEEPRMEVIEASDGDEAWRLARERLPDLVVLDVMMPGMSGWEVCRKIRQEAALAHTGVLMLTGIGENLNEATSPLFGADEYIDKPFDFARLDQKIESVLRQRAAARDAVPRPLANTRPGGKAGDAGKRRGSRPSGNGFGGPAKPAGSAPKKDTKKGKRGRKANAGAKKAASRKPDMPAGKGKRNMAAKKGAKKAAKKTAKKTAAKKTAKKTAKKAKKK
ncbi:MAG TPA: response regulator [Polyangiaceae bacterium]|nr:response regulator [Polyangiaceae bacterium]